MISVSISKKSVSTCWSRDRDGRSRRSGGGRSRLGPRKVIAEQQEREKEEAEKRKAEEAEAARRLLDGDLDSAGDADMAAAAILGLGSAEKSDDSSTPKSPRDDDACRGHPFG